MSPSAPHISHGRGVFALEWHTADAYRRVFARAFTSLYAGTAVGFVVAGAVLS